ncbi:MAG: heavy metal-responsive transcriptional regulator [Rhodospirillaceae bacterium]|nr:heavy metal-responsive transcriptional regulator [Rhodospirillaceae bacterium]
MDAMTIGKLAKAGGVGVDTLRYYERERLVLPAGRSRAGYRHYRHEAVRRVRFIKRAQSLGFSLNEIRSLLAFDGSNRATAADVLAVTKAKIAIHEADIAELRRLLVTLKRVAASCPGDETPARDCPVLHFLDPENGVPSITAAGNSRVGHRVRRP